MEVPMPPSESARLQALYQYDIMDSCPEQAYDDIVLLASQITCTPIALISLVDSDRQWFKARRGLDATETDRRLAFCGHAIMNPDRPMIVHDATLDDRFSRNPLVTGDPNIRFYAGAPLKTPSGLALGTVCVIDREPRVLEEAQIEALSALSRQVVAQLELRRLTGHLEEANERLSKDSTTDGLTGLMNRRAFDEALERETDQANRYNTSISLMIIDVDKFKSFNDSFGHQAGDDALKSVASILLEEARKSDLVFRYGGEEFACLLPHTDEKSAFVVAERMRKAFEKHSWKHRPVTISIGLDTVDDVHTKPEDLIKRADEALYNAKETGRNRTVRASAI